MEQSEAIEGGAAGGSGGSLVGGAPPARGGSVLRVPAHLVSSWEHFEGARSPGMRPGATGTVCVSASL